MDAPQRNAFFTLTLPSGPQACHAAFWSPAALPSQVSVCLSEFKLLAVVSGRGRLETREGETYILTPGSLAFRPPDVPHRLERCADAPWVEFALTLADPVYRHLAGLGVVPPGLQTGTVRMTKAWRMRFEGFLDEAESLHRQRQGPFLLRLQDLLIRLGRGEAKEAGVPRAFLEARRILSEKVEEPIAMPAVAAQAGLGYHSFRKGFVHYFRISPKEYRIRRVIEQAQNLLADPDLNLWEVARRLGYPDSATFSRQFKRVTGIPPSRFRTRCQ